MISLDNPCIVQKLENPKVDYITINGTRYPSIILYNISDYFKLIINNDDNVILDFTDNIINDFIYYFAYNLTITIENKNIPIFIQFLDYIQYKDNVIYSNIAHHYIVNCKDSISIIEEISFYLFKFISADQKLLLFNTYKKNYTFKLLKEDDISLILEYKQYTKSQLKNIYERKDINVPKIFYDFIINSKIGSYNEDESECSESD